MPDIELLKRPSREGDDSFQDHGDLQRVYTCELTNTSTSCVKKAVCHIQELKNKLENWQQQGKYRNDYIWRFDSSDSKIPVRATELFIEGTGLCLQRNYESNTLGQFCKGTDRVLLEVMTLLERLESDQQDANEALQKEHVKAQTLRKKKDCLSLWKQQQFPAAVQLEYEACIKDITELKWHLKVKKDLMQQVRNSLSNTETQNRWLVEDIDFVKKHGPLVKEKLQLESKIMKQIKSAQTEVSKMFTKLSCELSGSQHELENEELLVNKERRVMKIELKDIRTQLKDRLADLQQLKSNWDFYCTAINKAEEKVASNEKQFDAMLLQIPLLETQENKLSDTGMKLREKLVDQDRRLGEKQSEIVHLQKQIQTTRHESESKLSACEEIFRWKRQELLYLHDEHKKHEIEMEDYNKKIHQSKQAVKQLQRSCKRILEKISQNVEEKERAKGELTLEAAHHANTKAKLEELEQQTFMQEHRMKKKTEKLKLQLMSAMKLAAALKGTILTLMEEHDMVKINYERVKNELLEQYENAASTATQQENKMTELKEIYTVKFEKIVDLKKKLSDILAENKCLSDDQEEQKSTCLEHLTSVKKAHSTVSMRCENMSCQIEELRVKSEEYRKASDVMKQITTTMPHILEELQSVSNIVEFKQNTARIVINNLQSDIEACRSRTGISEHAHFNLLAQRQAIMLDIKANLRNTLKENKELAQEYRMLQKSVLISRQEAASVFDSKNKVEASFHDHKQLSLLQRRMHKAMLKYFKHRSVYSQAELARFQALSNQNNQKMKALQEELSRAIHRISAFLHSLTDDSTTSHDAVVAAAADKPRGMDNDRLNRVIPTVQIAE